MNRIRIAVLVMIAVGVVAAYLLAPDEGMVSRVPTMVLLGVLALIWSLALTPGVPAGPADRAPAPESSPRPRDEAASPEHSPGHLEPESESESEPEHQPVPSAPPEVAVEPDSPAPEQPADWPTPLVQVPRVFQASTDEIIDLRSPPAPPAAGTSTPDVIAPEVIAPDAVTPGEGTAGHGDAPVDDPWLAFAASMFAPKE
jgi:hypothetical protein